MTLENTVQQIAEKSVRGSTDVFISQIVAAVISALGLSIIARSLGPALFGDIAVIMVLPSLAVIFTDWAVSHGITRYAARFKARGRVDRVWNIAKVGLLFEISTGLLMTIISIMIGPIFASNSLRRSNLAPLLGVASWTILGQTMLVASKSILIGLDRTKRFGSIIILNSFLLGILPALFVLYGLGVPGAIEGMAFGSLVLGAISIMTLAGVISREKTASEDTSSIKTDLKLLLSYSLPVYLAVVAASALPQVLYLIGANFLTPWDLGNYSGAIRLGTLMTFVSLPILTVIFPAFSKLDVKEKKEELKALYTQGIKYTALVVVPITGLMISIATQIVTILYGSEYSLTPLYLSIYLVTYFYAVIGSMVVGGFLRGQGHTRVYLGMGVVLFICGAVLGTTLTPLFGGVGLIFASTLSTLIAFSLVVIWMANYYGFKPSLVAAAKTMITVTISIIVALYFGFLFSEITLIAQTLLIAAIFGAVYFVLAGTIRLISYEDYINLKKMFESLGSLGVPVIYILAAYRRLALREPPR